MNVVIEKMVSLTSGDYLFRKECCATLDDTAELAYVSTAVAADEEIDGYTNKVGGRAVLFAPQTMPKCSACNEPLAVVLQAYLPLADPPDDQRQLIVCVCANSACKLPPAKRFSAFRTKVASSSSQSQETPSSSAAVAPTTDAQPGLFAECSSWDIDDDDDGESASAMLVTADVVPSKGEETIVESAKSYECTEVGKESFEAFYLETDYEPDGSGNSAAEDAEVRELLSRYEAQKVADEAEEEKASKKSGGKKGKETVDSGFEDVYEHSTGDRAFRRFQRRLQRAPEQVMRWCYGGKPLQLCDATPLEALCIPRCPHCGAPRVFEAQLMPALLDKLHLLNSKPSPSVTLPSPVVPGSSSAAAATALNQSLPYEFGSIIICTCSKDCDTHGTLTQEHLIWQPCL